MTAALLVNGVSPGDPLQAIAVEDRGFQYGDGLFETALLIDGRVRFLEHHLQTLALGCERLGIDAPDRRRCCDRDRAACSAGRRRAACSRSSSRAASGRAVIGRPPRSETHIASSRCIRRRSRHARGSRCAGARRGSVEMPAWPASSISTASSRCWRKAEWRDEAIRRRLDARHRGRAGQRHGEQRVPGARRRAGHARSALLRRARRHARRSVARCRRAGLSGQRGAAVAAGRGNGERSVHHQRRARHPLGRPSSARCDGASRAASRDRLRGGIGICDATTAAICSRCSSCSASSPRARSRGGAIGGCSSRSPALQEPSDVRSAARRQLRTRREQRCNERRLAGSAASLDRVGALTRARRIVESR